MNSRLPLIIVLAALLPTLAIVWSRLDQCAERRADAALLAILDEYDFRNDPTMSRERQIQDLRDWLSSHGTHPLGATLKNGFWWYDHDPRPELKEFRQGQIETHLKRLRSMIVVNR